MVVNTRHAITSGKAVDNIGRRQVVKPKSKKSAKKVVKEVVKRVIDTEAVKARKAELRIRLNVNTQIVGISGEIGREYKREINAAARAAQAARTAKAAQTAQANGEAAAQALENAPGGAEEGAAKVQPNEEVEIRAGKSAPVAVPIPEADWITWDKPTTKWGLYRNKDGKIVYDHVDRKTGVKTQVHPTAIYRDGFQGAGEDGYCSCLAEGRPLTPTARAFDYNPKIRATFVDCEVCHTTVSCCVSQCSD